MSRTITALFDTRADAEAGRQRLLDANVHADDVRIHDKSALGATGYSSHKEPGLWASIKNAFLPDEDRHVYEEGVRRGGFLLTADVDDDRAGAAVNALDNAQAQGIDIDARAGQWRSEGWNTPSLSGTADSAAFAADDEDRLIVGQRDADRGGVRARSYATETPLHEQLRLRD